MFNRSFFFFIILIVVGLLVFLLSGALSDSYSLAINAQSNAIKKRIEIVNMSLLLQAVETREEAMSWKDEESFTMLFVGDILLARGVGEISDRQEDPKYPFLKISDVIQKADIAFANLEAPISDRGRNQGSIYSFRVSPKMIEGLSYAGFDILSFANNHSMDYGEDALADTINLTSAAGIHTIGAGLSYDDANKPFVLESRGTRIAFLAYTNLLPRGLEAGVARPGISSFDLPRVTKIISELKESGKADIVAVSFHWGEEYKTQANEKQKNIAHALVDAGADLVVGHHPHVVQEVEQYKNGWIAYSLGNFVFDQNFSEETMHGLMILADAQNKRISWVRKAGIFISRGFQPSLIEDNVAVALREVMTSHLQKNGDLDPAP